MQTTLPATGWHWDTDGAIVIDNLAAFKAAQRIARARKVVRRKAARKAERGE